MLEPVPAAALQRDEGVARADRARIERETRDRDLRRRRDPGEQLVEAHAAVMAPLPRRPTGVTRARSSGATDIRRSAPEVTAENTGAATSPP